jgi:hypothetical protein
MSDMRHLCRVTVVAATLMASIAIALLPGGYLSEALYGAESVIQGLHGTGLALPAVASESMAPMMAHQSPHAP